MTKQEFIKSAYIAAGVDWEAVKKCINSDGYLDIYSNYYTKEVLTIVSPYIKGWDKKGHLEYRPKSLRGIEDNAGWIKIESEADLPSEECSVVILINGLEFSGWFSSDDNSFEIGENKYTNATHWRLKEFYSKPLY